MMTVTQATPHITVASEENKRRKQAKNQSAAVGSLIIKMQLCGKDNCRCKKHGERHGPYAWLVRYMPKETGEAGKNHTSYEWKYLGKATKKEKIIEKMKEYMSEAGRKQLEKALDAYLREFEAKPRERKPSQKILIK